jgi:EAL domain-containing protein (putative c-di-GMP-specific phosphodiesterase class I)
VRVGLASACDLEAVRLGIARLAETGDPIAINVAPRSLIEPGFLERLDVLLAGAGAAAARISVEVSERGLDPQLAGLEGWPKCWRGMARSWGSNISAASWRRCRLYALRLAYLKLDGSFVAGLDDNAATSAW